MSAAPRSGAPGRPRQTRALEPRLLAAARWLLAGLTASAVSWLLLLAVQALVAPHEHATPEHLPALRVDWLRVPDETPARRKQRRLPEPPPEPVATPPAPPRPAPPAAAVAPQVDARLAGLEVRALPTESLLLAPSDAGLLGDLDVVPLVRVPPEYPPRAAERGIGGWVLLEFTVTKSGSVADVRVVDADPEGLFDRAAVRAARRFQYRPRMRDGRPVDRPGVQLLLRFQPDAGPSGSG